MAQIITVKSGATNEIQYPRTVKSALLNDDGTPLIFADSVSVDTKIDKTAIVDDLTTGGATNVLSAEQGKVLNSAIGQIGSDLATHKAESVTHVTTATRDISLIGEQIISVLSGKIPKSVRIYAIIPTTPVASWGLENQCIRQGYDGNASSNAFAVDLLTASATAGRCAISAKNAGSITLNWTKAGSPIGTAFLVIETTYHGGI